MAVGVSPGFYRALCIGSEEVIMGRDYFAEEVSTIPLAKQMQCTPIGGAGMPISARQPIEQPALFGQALGKEAKSLLGRKR